MEILKLRWSDVDRQRGFITLRDPKGGPDQKIPLSEATSDVLNGITPQNENPHIFPGRFAGSAIRGQSHFQFYIPIAALPFARNQRGYRITDQPRG